MRYTLDWVVALALLLLALTVVALGQWWKR